MSMACPAWRSTAGGSVSALVLGFTKRLRRQVQLDDVLRMHVVPQDVVGALDPGLQDCMPWPVRRMRPLPRKSEHDLNSFNEGWEKNLPTVLAGLCRC